MYNFKQWIEIKRKKIVENDFTRTDVIDKFKFNPTNNSMDVGEDYEKIQKEVTKLISTKYQQKYMNFLNSIAEENSDDELKELIHKLKMDNSYGLNKRAWRPNSFQRDEIVPPSSDKGSDQNSEE